MKVGSVICDKSEMLIEKKKCWQMTHYPIHATVIIGRPSLHVVQFMQLIVTAVMQMSIATVETVYCWSQCCCRGWMT